MACVVCVVWVLTRASKMLVETRSRIHETYSLRRADVAFFRGQAQLGVAQWSRADRVEVRFRGSNGDQLRVFRAFRRVHRCPWGPVVVMSILCLS